jgi:YesN/AraC family two-component response regulator
MKYQEYIPHQLLKPYIDCYWTIKTDDLDKLEIQRVLPDACSDIILNIGADIETTNQTVHYLKNKKTYLVGTMNSYKETLMASNTFLLGIRFKPFGIYSLLGYSMQGTSDQVVELGKDNFHLSHTHFIGKRVDGKLNQFFLERLSEKNKPLAAIANTIYNFRGNISLQKLSQLHFITERQIERLFQSKVGSNFKEVCNQIRFQNALKLIKDNNPKSLFDIAFDTGYYDHSHLLKEVKKYSGLLPSQIV